MKNFFKENLILLLRILCASLLVTGGYLTEGFNGYLSLILFSVSYVILCYDTVIGAFKELFTEKTVSDKMLMVIASLGAMIIGEFLEANVILVLFLIGELFEDTAKESSKKSIEILVGLQSDRVRLKDGSVIQAKEIKVDDVVEVFPGERIAVDGVVVGGIGTVDTSVITGESTPKTVKQGSKVLAGYLNYNAPITIRVTRPLSGSVAQRIVDVVEKSFDKKTKSEKFIKKFAKIYTPIVILISVLIAFLPPLIDMIAPIFGNFGFTFWIYKALGVLAISCPCSILISVPLAYFCGVGFASKKGILIKGSYIIDILRDVEIFAFDKTGTLTKSELVVTSVDSYNEEYDKLKLMQLVTLVEHKSRHPLAVAITTLAERFNIEIIEGENYIETPGSGVECDSQYGHIKAGTRNFANAPEWVVASVYISVDGKFVGTIDVGDQLKKNSKSVFEKLRKLGVKKKIILSGDKKIKVDQVAKTLLAETAYSNLKPVDKLHALEDIKTNNPGMKIAYCGDGINDIPALVNADVGISMGAMGSDSAVEASDVVIMDDNLENIVKAIKIAKKTHRTAVFNIAISLIVKIAVLVLLSIPLIQFKMMYAVLADVGLLIFTIINALLAGR
ncbi:MAG: cadmium-translocating P-type ATPase [Clostridia bacterium]|nr:cadmium-translocating P-type ATPase [Clostridia bacterium]